MIEDANPLDAIVHDDFASFIASAFATLCPGESNPENWHIDWLAWRVAPVAARRRLRLLINLPLRS
jgi:hypothetical protein